MIDLTKLTPAPWNVIGQFIVSNKDIWICDFIQNDPSEDAEFIALARNAFEVIMRRKWEAQWWLAEGEVFGVDSALEILPEQLQKMRWPDPFTALVEADRWMTDQEAKRS